MLIRHFRVCVRERNLRSVYRACDHWNDKQNVDPNVTEIKKASDLDGFLGVFYAEASWYPFNHQHFPGAVVKLDHGELEQTPAVYKIAVWRLD